MKKRFLSIILLFLTTLPLLAQQYTEADIHLYIEKYKDLAIRKMYEYKIPASITLAQGVFESACGTSRLATYGNNHFGIKCHKEWEGDTIVVDDDELGECFRRYEKAEESYNDHSLFLTSRPRYSKLFELDVMDYKAWAKGLKAAGYATNPHYAERLISLIERFNIAKHDTTYLERLESGYFTRVQEDVVLEDVRKEEVLAAKTPVKNEVRKEVSRKGETMKGEVKPQGSTVPRVYFKADPQNFTAVSYPFSDRPVYENNKVHFVIADEGETFESIGQDVQLPATVLRSYNDAEAGVEPQQGEVIYVDRKAKKHAKGSHIVKPGETLRLISQQYGVQLNMIFRYNKLDKKSVIHPDQEIKLKK
ncbi:glucosaminidase domain-containing protein [Bacteroidales bacterium OttesenSCG-928-A14]|nr:glucosaminidase domain-containing protein [Bacteroidales bacterium OttesenSCG-928-A14]